MGILDALESLGEPEAAEPVEIDLNGRKVKFREPLTTDLSIPEAAEKILKANFPAMPASRRLEVNMLARCYMPAPGEKEVKALEAFGAFASKHDRKFTDFMGEFSKAFPAFTDWLTTKADAKNASRESEEMPGTSA